jgi:signal transduction histidine kinase
LRQDFRTYGIQVGGNAWDDFEQDFDRLTGAMTEMTDEANLIFSYFAQEQPELAGRRMATMDRKYANLNRALADMRQDVASIQRHNFDEQQAMAASLANLDYVIAGFILLMVGAATLYGHKMAQRVEADARERDRSAAERNRLYTALAEREHELAELVRRLLVAQEEERRRIAREVHDGLAQLATAAQQHLEAFSARVRPRSSEARAELAQARDLAQQTVREARWVIAGLRPTALDDFGLAAAIRLEIEALRMGGWQVTYAEDLGPQRLPTETETALFRVAQEALRNVRKHAGASRVHVALHGRPQAVRLEVRDWGRGFARGRSEHERRGAHVGIPAMHERVALLGGHCAVDSRPGAGTHVRVEVPVSVARAAC